MGFLRKAALFTHWAALHAETLAVSQQECYQVMIGLFSSAENNGSASLHVHVMMLTVAMVTSWSCDLHSACTLLILVYVHVHVCNNALLLW